MEGGGGLKSSDMSIEDELQIGSCDHQSDPNPECLELETAAGSHHHHHHHHHPHPHPHPHPHHHQEEYLFEQMLSSLPNCPSWPDLISSSSNPSTAGGDPMDPHLLLLGRSQHVDMGGTDGSVQALFNGFPGGGTLHGNGQPTSQQPPFENFGDAMNQAPPTSVSKGGSGGGQAPQRQRVRARRGQATDPHSIAERLRRERIAERMKGLQQLVPNANKTDKASMLDEIIDYVKFLQVQVKVLSMSRLGGKAGVAPLVAGLSSEGGSSVGIGPGSNRTQEAGSTNDSMLVMENQVVKLMEEDMGSAMQYLQGKGLCLMPISLATAISTATCSRSPSNGSLHNGNHQANGVNTNSRPLPPLNGNGSAKGNGEGPSSPSLSVLSVQSGNLANGDASVKDPTPSSQA